MPGKLNAAILADLKMWFGRSLRIIVPIACSAALIIWMFKKVNFHEMIQVIQHNVRFEWILAMVFFNFLSYLIRARRWGLQLQNVGISVKYNTLCVSIFGAYALNLIFTALGEAWRCVFIAKAKNAKISTVVGTDLGDRSSDGIMVLLVLAFTLLVADNTVREFMHQYAIGRDVDRLLDNPWLWAGIALAIALAWGIFHFFSKLKLVSEAEQSLLRIWQGFKVIFTMPQIGMYLLLTVGIWGCYFMQTYIAFFAFPFTRELITPHLAYGLLPGLVALTFGSMSMGIPSSGGLGPWNLAIMFALSLYGISDTQGAAFAMLLWSSEALLQIALGIYSIAYVERLDAKNNLQQKQQIS